MSEKKDENVVGAAAIKPHGWDRSGWEAFKYFLYDAEQGKVLGRTPRSWLLIFIFYVTFYACLMLFWFSLLGIFFQTLPPYSDGPKLVGEKSYIGSDPGLYLRYFPNLYLTKTCNI